jgi:outer membrane lipoprotein-sorting protein
MRASHPTTGSTSMTSGSSRQSFRAVIALLFCLAAGFPATAAEGQGAWSLDQLMKGLSEIMGASTKYTEDQYIGIATKPLRSSGELVYAAPNRIEKNRLTPSQQSVVIDGDRLTMRQAKGRARTVRLSEHPEIGAFIESIRSTLSGDVAALNRYYKVAVMGDADQWELTLEPTDDRVRNLVNVVRIGGSQYTLLSVEIVHADGDRSVMTMENSGQ